MSRLRLGLVALVAALLVDIVDVQFDDLDVMHDALALALYAVAGWGAAQPGARAAGAFTPFFWLPTGACALALLLEISDASWTYGFFLRLAAFLASAGGLLLFTVGMIQLTKGTSLASSTRWRRAMFELALLVVLPGVAIGFLMTDPSSELPFRHAPGSLDSTWWKEAIAWGAVIGAVLASFDTAMASVVTFRSAGRR